MLAPKDVDMSRRLGKYETIERKSTVFVGGHATHNVHVDIQLDHIVHVDELLFALGELPVDNEHFLAIDVALQDTVDASAQTLAGDSLLDGVHKHVVEFHEGQEIVVQTL